ncbi:MAG: SBBP repeat-containing protein, partial [Verrucomicrobiales bacterium]|nr:SBBP repeat-containing protein [Verrucomicrobiales bacterium]
MNTTNFKRASIDLYISIVLFAACASDALAQAPEFLWVRSPGYNLNAIATDSAGNVLVTGSFAEADFGGVILTSAGSYDMFVAKYSPDGILMWVRQAGGGEGATGSDVATDSAGNVLVTGCFFETAEFDGTLLRSAGRFRRSDIFLAKYDAEGRLQWARGAGGDRLDSGLKVVSDGAGNIVVAGEFSGTAVFSGISRRSSGSGRDIFVAKYDPDGGIQWVQTAGGGSFIDARGLAVDYEGNFLISGHFSEIAFFGGIRRMSRGGSDLFVAKYDPAGMIQWVETAGTPTEDTAAGIATDSAGNIVFTGVFGGSTIEFDGESITSAGSNDIFLSKYGPDGSKLWVKRAGGPGIDMGIGLAIDDAGNVAITGYFSELAEFDGHVLSSAGHDDIFVAEYDPAGEFRWAKRAGGESSDQGWDLVADLAGNLLLQGTFGETAIFDGISVTGGDEFLAKLAHRAPEPDRYEENDGPALAANLTEPWEHIHARCPAEIRRALLDPDAECPGVFENGFAPRGAEEIWTLTVSDLSLDVGDRDFFRVLLPDPGDPDYGPGHADIRPSTPPFRDLYPVPMPECGFLDREDLAPGGLSRHVNLTVQGLLTIEAIPRANALSERAISAEGESIHLYWGDLPADELASGSSLRKTIACPRTEHGLSELVLSFGERAGERSLAESGGYELRLEYRIEIQREIPDWVREDAERRGLRAIGDVPCFSLTPQGFRPDAGFDGSFMPREDFPFCPGFDLKSLTRLELEHPLEVTQPIAVNGPPIFVELFTFQWPSNAPPFDVAFSSGMNLSFELVDAEQNAIGKAVPLQNQGGANAVWQYLRLPELKPGLYCLVVTGP